MKVLVACEFSGRVRAAFEQRGHYAMSCDLEPSLIPGNHYQGDVFDVIDRGWDLMVAFPPCTYLSKAGARWWHDPSRLRLANDAADFVYRLFAADIPRIAIENPIGQLSNRWFKPGQYIEPYWFGDPYSKRTCLWLKNLPLLVPTKYVDYVSYIDNWSGVRDPRQRSLTFPGIANAMAEQWGNLV